MSSSTIDPPTALTPHSGPTEGAEESRRHAGPAALPPSFDTPAEAESWDPFSSPRSPVTPKAMAPRQPRLRLPLILFLLTCLSTAVTGGPLYGVALMTILLCHEFGHFLQARRYGVPASYPYFLPLPLVSPFGTLGAVIAMRPHSATGRGLYDIAISGPLAGLVPTALFAVIGLKQSSFVPNSELPEGPSLIFGEPLLFRWLSELVLGPAPADHTLMLGALGFAAWVGIFITALNLVPVGQLDGGHILYALTPRYAHIVSTSLFAAGWAGVILFKLWHWTPLLGLLMLVGVRHPPVYDQPPFDLGLGRRVLGWAILLFVFIGLTPTPIDITGQ